MSQIPQLTANLLTEDYIIKPFDCNDDDLNRFLFEKAKLYKKELISTTFIFENSTKTVAYYSVLNDGFNVEEDFFSSKNAWKRFLSELVSHPKRYLKSFPAVKIGRLGVDNSFKGKGLGKLIINSIIKDCLELNNKQACKIVTVDAYHQSSLFYQQLGFKYLTENDQDHDIRQMYFDLTKLQTNPG